MPRRAALFRTCMWTPSRRQKSSPPVRLPRSARTFRSAVPRRCAGRWRGQPVHKHGGKYLSRCGSVKTLEGKPLETTVIALLEFPSVDAVQAFATDPN
ncbi:MAG: DUF1330 domain-containing protein [Hyphomicrobiaceae bacterium]